MRFPAFAPLSLLSCVSTPATPVRPWFRRLDANPNVMFRPCGFTPLRRLAPHKSPEDIAPQFRKGFVAFLDLRSLSARPRRNVFTLWIETYLLIPRNAVAPRSVSSPTAVPRRRGRCPLEVASRFADFLARGFSIIAALDALPTDKVVLSGSTWVAQSLLSRFHGRMSAASLGRSPSRPCSIGEFGASFPRCRIKEDPFLPWVFVLFQVRLHVSMRAARCTP